jgi:membrane protein required for colicin V production
MPLNNVDLLSPHCRQHLGRWTVNSFDAIICGMAALAVFMGINSGLLRSLATIVGYVAAMPIAVTVSPQLSQFIADQLSVWRLQDGEVLCAVFLLVGLVLSALFRFSVSEMVGSEISIPDRLAGGLLGGVRIGVLAVLMVMVFDRVIPAGQDPAFLNGSRLRPLLTMLGQRTLKSLPQDVTEYVDQLKRERGI